MDYSSKDGKSASSLLDRSYDLFPIISTDKSDVFLPRLHDSTLLLLIVVTLNTKYFDFIK